MAKVLIVDDDPDVLKLVQKVLESKNYEVFVAENAIKAMDFLNSSHFDLLISDAQMPHLSGFELISTLKSNKRLQKMATAMLTGLRERKDIEKAIRAGIDDYIIKPIEPLVLLQKVENILSKKPAQKILECEIPDSLKLSQSICHIPIRILKISEMGLVISTAFSLPEGHDLEVSLDVLKRLGLKAPQMRVLRSQVMPNGHFEIRIGFVGVQENFTSTLRHWIDNHLNPKKGAA